MSKFKIGDYVVVKKEVSYVNAKFGYYEANYMGVVKSIDNTGNPDTSSIIIRLTGRNDLVLHVHESEIELDTIPNSKLFKVLSK